MNFGFSNMEVIDDLNKRILWNGGSQSLMGGGPMKKKREGIQNSVYCNLCPLL